MACPQSCLKGIEEWGEGGGFLKLHWQLIIVLKTDLILLAIAK
ncbi:MAG: hypothetical protein O9317_00475 [Microcystis sp. LE19-59.1C]|nr:hypothetical protein [Microcystis sp. LE19-59.1C]